MVWSEGLSSSKEEKVRPRVMREDKNIPRSLAGSDWQKESKSIKLISPWFNRTWTGRNVPWEGTKGSWGVAASSWRIRSRNGLAPEDRFGKTAESCITCVCTSAISSSQGLAFPILTSDRWSSASPCAVFCIASFNVAIDSGVSASSTDRNRSARVCSSQTGPWTNTRRSES